MRTELPAYSTPYHAYIMAIVLTETFKLYLVFYNYIIS